MILPAGAVAVTCTLFRHTGGWTFAILPPEAGLPAGRAWGMVPVIARVNGHTWATSVWRQREGDHLPVPARVRRGFVGDQIVVELALDPARA